MYMIKIGIVAPLILFLFFTSCFIGKDGTIVSDFKLESFLTVTLLICLGPSFPNI